MCIWCRKIKVTAFGVSNKYLILKTSFFVDFSIDKCLSSVMTWLEHRMLLQLCFCNDQKDHIFEHLRPLSKLIFLSRLAFERGFGILGYYRKNPHFSPMPCLVARNITRTPSLEIWVYFSHSLRTPFRQCSWLFFFFLLSSFQLRLAQCTTISLTYRLLASTNF